jgi:hypothetical protein
LQELSLKIKIVGTCHSMKCQQNKFIIVFSYQNDDGKFEVLTIMMPMMTAILNLFWMIEKKKQIIENK